MKNFAEFRKTVEGMPAMFPADMESFGKAVRRSADFGEKMSKVAIDAAEKNVKISTDGTRATLARLNEIAQAKEHPSEYARAIGEFASESASAASKHLAAIAEVAMNVHRNTLEIFVDAGKKVRQDAAEAAVKTPNETVKDGTTRI